MYSLKNFHQFIGESSSSEELEAFSPEELEAMRYLMSVGLLTSPLEAFRAALSDEGDSELLQYNPEVSQVSDTAINLSFYFDGDYHFADLADELIEDLELDDDIRLEPEIDLEVELNWQTGALTWKVKVVDDEIGLREVEVLQGGPDEQYSVLDPDGVEQVLAAVESFIGDGPLINGRHQTEIYGFIRQAYEKRAQQLRGEDDEEE